MATIRFTWNVNDVPTNVASAVLSNAAGTIGVRRTDTSEVLVAAGTALNNPSAGVYEYEITEPAPNLAYEYWVKIIDVTGATPVYLHDFVDGETTTSRTLQFVAVKAGALVTLGAAPKLSSPHGTFGVKRIDTGATVVADGQSYTHDGGGKYSVAFNEPDEHLTYRYYVEAVIDSVTYYLPRTTALMSSACLAIGRYTDSHRIERQFGIDNVHKWIALDDYDEPVDYALRLYELIAAAEAELDDALRDSAVSVPLSTVPLIITEIATALAAVRFYEARGVTDFNPETGQPQHRLHYQKKEAWRRLALLKTGNMRLSGETVKRHPECVIDDDD